MAAYDTLTYRGIMALSAKARSAAVENGKPGAFT
jgi:hypothetical protein